MRHRRLGKDKRMAWNAEKSNPAAVAFRAVRPLRSPSDPMSASPLVIGKFSLGMGDRFAHEAEAQLAACLAAKKLGVEIVPVWNKSNREHNIIGSEPTSTRAATPPWSRSPS